MTKIAVIGIGQSMRGDDGAGIEAVRQWRIKFPQTASRPDICIEASELPGLTLLEKICDAESVILVDAVQSGSDPGTIHHLRETDLLSFTSDSNFSHGWGVSETIRMGRQLAQINSVIRIIGLEAEQFEIGKGLSSSIRDKMPAICDLLEEEVQSFLKQ